MNYKIELVIDEHLNNKKIINKFNILNNYVKINNLNIKFNIINYYSIDNNLKDKYKKVFYLPSWVFYKDNDILIISGDHLIKALKTQLINFFKE